MFYFCICVFKKLELCFGGTWNAEREGPGWVNRGREGDLHNFSKWELLGWGVNFSYGELANFLDMQNTDQYYIELSIKCCFFFLVSQVSNMVVLSKIIMQLKFLLLDI